MNIHSMIITAEPMTRHCPTACRSSLHDDVVGVRRFHRIGHLLSLAAVSGNVFISYRRDDAMSEAGRLADAIRSQFGQNSVFLDTSDTPLGADWPETLRRALENAAAVAIMIGPEWILARDEYGRRRIDDPNDWVRREVQLALSQRKRIIPLLIRHARMIPSEALPSEIASLASRQAFEIRNESWAHDIELVLSELASHLGRNRSGKPLLNMPTKEVSPVTADDFRAVALGFDSTDVRVRRATASKIKEIAAFLELDEILAFGQSQKTAERVGAAVALGVHIRSSQEARADRRVLSTLGELLNDPWSSLVRYRGAELLRSSPALVPMYEDDLGQLANTDPNPGVRQMAVAALRPARRSEPVSEWGYPDAGSGS